MRGARWVRTSGRWEGGDRDIKDGGYKETLESALGVKAFLV